MATLKDYIRKIKLWWRYFIFIFLLLGSYQFANADTFDNFDTMTNGQKINTISYFASSSDYSVVSNTKSYSSPNSVDITTGRVDPNKMGMSFINHSLISKISFYFNITSAQSNTNELTFYFFSTNDNLNNIILSLKRSISGDDIIAYANGETHIIKPNGTISSNTWYRIDLIYDRVNLRYNINFNNTGASAWFNSSTTTSPMLDFTFLENSNFSQVNIDDFATEIFYYPTNLTDTIWFYTPVSPLGVTSIYTLNPSSKTFMWGVNYQLSTSTIATYANDDLYIAIDYQHASATIPTELVRRNPQQFYFLNATTTYSLAITDKYDYPTELGYYMATTSLYSKSVVGDRVLLGVGTTSFAIGTSSSFFNSAWCSGLCSDITYFQNASSTSWYDVFSWYDQIVTSIKNIPLSLSCTARYVLCFAVQPHEATQEYLDNSFLKIKNGFPFSTFFQLTDIVNEELATSTTCTSNILPMPMIRTVGTTTEYFMISGLSSSSVSNAIGNTNATLFKNTLIWIIWGVVISIVFLLIFNL